MQTLLHFEVFLSNFMLLFPRFSLLLLEPSEIYFEDFSVFYYPPGLSDEEAESK